MGGRCNSLSCPLDSFPGLSYPPPWLSSPRGASCEGRCNSLSCPLDSLPPGGQAATGYLTPHPGYLHPRGASCPGRCNSLSCPLDSLPPGGQAVPGYLTPHPGYLHPRGASCPGRFILPPTHTGAIILSDVFNLFAIYCKHHTTKFSLYGRGGKINQPGQLAPGGENN